MEKHISLKEAAEISGYSPDYVGQLIRSGKLEGKKVFSNVVWVTTEEAIRDYIQNNTKTGTTASDAGWKDAFKKVFDVGTLYVAVQVGAIALATVFILLLMYIFSVSVDHHIDRMFQQKLESAI